MNEKDKLRAEIEAKLTEFDKTIEQLEIEAERNKEKFDLNRKEILQNLKTQRFHIKARLGEIDQSENEDTWQKQRQYLESYIKDMDKNIRKALATDTGFF